MNQPASGSELASGFEYDPAYLSALRELYVMLGTLGICLLWSVGYCGLFAYQSSDATRTISIIWGIPSWVIWGIGLPWATCGLFTIWYSLFCIQDDDADLLAEKSSAENCPTITEGSPSK